MEAHRDRRTVAGIDTTVYDTGAGRGAPAVLMVHGGDPRSLSNALDWSTVWAPEELGARLVAYDKPGQGLTYTPGMPGSAMTAEALSTHLEEIAERLGPGPLVLVGHSRGALPVADVARRRPDLVAGLVLVASNTLASPSERTPKDFYHRAYADPPDQPTEEYVRREPTMNSWSAGHVDDNLVAGRMRAALANGWWADASHRTEIHETAVIPSLQRLRAAVLDDLREHGARVPVLQLWGQEDVSAPVELGHGLFATLGASPHACSSLVVNHSGHYVYRERPQAFLAAVGSFVRTVRT